MLRWLQDHPSWGLILSHNTPDNAVGRSADEKDHPGSLGLNYSKYSKLHFSSSCLSHSSGGGFLFGRVNLTGDKDDLSCLIASHCVPTGYVVLVGCRVFLDPSPWQYSEEEENKQNSEPSLCVLTIILLPLFI